MSNEKIESLPATIQPKILWQGSIDESQLTVTSTDQSNRAIDTNVEAKLRASWNQKVIEAQSKGAVLYDGISYRLEEFTFNNGVLSFTVSPMQFSVRSTLKKMPELVTLGEEYYSHGLSIGGFLITSDGKHVFARKSAKSMSSLQRDFVGGVLESIEPMSGIGLLNENKRELKEEVNVDAEMIDTMKIIGLVRSSTTDIVIATSTKLNISSSELKDIFDKREDLELEGIEIIDPENLNNYLNELGGYKPTMAKLLK